MPDAAEIRRRWPQFHVTDDALFYQSEGGIAPAAAGNAAHRRNAIAHGATLRDNLPVRQVRTGGEIEVVTMTASIAASGSSSLAARTKPGAGPLA